MEFMRQRLSEPSTWRGLVVLAGLLGYTTTPEQGDAIIATAVAVVGLIGVFAPDKTHGVGMNRSDK